MPLRDKLVLIDGKARPPAFLRKVCVHNGNADLPLRYRGDMGFDLEFLLGRQTEIYCCIQCGHTFSAETMWKLYQAYMAYGQSIVVGRNIKTEA